MTRRDFVSVVLGMPIVAPVWGVRRPEMRAETSRLQDFYTPESVAALKEGLIYPREEVDLTGSSTEYAVYWRNSKSGGITDYLGNEINLGR